MKIHGIQTGSVRIRTKQLQQAPGMMPKLMKIFLDRTWSDWLPIYCWAIEHDEGVIVVDTGDTHRTTVKGYLPKWHPYYVLGVQFDIQPAEEVGPQLRTLGIDPEKDVSKVVLTHLHTDHAGGMHHFPNAEFIIEANHFREASGISGILAGYLPHRWPDWLSPRLIHLDDEPYGPFNRSMPLTSDGRIMVVETPGHVANHISVIVHHNGLYYMLAGDTSYNEQNMLLSIPDGIGTSETASTLDTIRAFTTRNPTVYLPAHDPGALTRLKKTVITTNYGEGIGNSLPLIAMQA